MPDPSFVIPLLVQSGLVPFALSLIVLFLFRTFSRAPGPSALIAVAAGFGASYFAVYGTQWPAIPRQALDWLPWITVLGGPCAWVIEAKALPPHRAIAARLAVCVLAAWAILQPASANVSWFTAAIYVFGAGFVMSAAWTYLVQAGRARTAPPTLLAVVAGGSALALVIDASQSIGQLNGALASALAAWLAFSTLRSRPGFSGSATGLSVLLLGSLLLAAHYYAGFSLVHVAILASGLFADLIVHFALRGRKQASGAGAWVATAVLAGIPALVVIGLALKTMQESGGY